MAGWVDAGHKVFVAREHNDHHEIGGERDINKRQYAEDNVGLAGPPGVHDKVIEDAQELQQKHQQADDQPEIKRRPQSAAVEYRHLDCVLNTAKRSETSWRRRALSCHGM